MHTFTLKQLIAELRSLCQDAGNQAAWAKQKGIAPQVVSDVLNNRRDPAEVILKAMSLEKTPTTYRRIPR